VFPKTEYAPAKLTELAIHAAVAGFVCGEFFQPESATGRRECGVLRTAMPEAAINKNHDTILWKGEVRSSRQTEMPSPTLDAGPPK